MATESLLGIVGIAATAIFGIWAILQNKAVRIAFVRDQVISLVTDIMQNQPELKISFRGNPVSLSLVLLKGYLINTGKKDISPEMVEESISANLPEGFEWMGCKIVQNSPRLKVLVENIGKNRIVFKTGLWKSREFFKFEVLAQIPGVSLDNPIVDPMNRLNRAITFSHRIADLGGIRQIVVSDSFSTSHKSRLR